MTLKQSIRRPGPVGWASRQRVTITAVLTGAIVIVAGTVTLGRAANLGTLDAGTLDPSTTSILPTAQVRDLFPESAGTNLNGLVTDFNDGNGWTVNAGPTWSSGTGWVVNPTGSARRTAASGQIAALFPFLSHNSSAAVQVTGRTTSSDVGPMLFSSNSPTAPNGVYANVYGGNATSATFTIWNMDTGSACGGSQTITFTNPTTTFDLSLSYDTPTTTLTAKVTPLGQGTTTRTCSYTPTAGRTYAGLMSYTNTTASYKNLLFSYQ